MARKRKASEEAIPDDDDDLIVDYVSVVTKPAALPQPRNPTELRAYRKAQKALSSRPGPNVGTSRSGPLDEVPPPPPPKNKPKNLPSKSTPREQTLFPSAGPSARYGPSNEPHRPVHGWYRPKRGRRY